jgi:protein-disulfide isomerase
MKGAQLRPSPARSSHERNACPKGGLTMDGGRSQSSFTSKELYFYVAVALLIGFGSGAGAAGLFVGRSAGSGQVGVADAAAGAPTAGSPQAELPRIEVTTEGRPAWGPEDAAVTIVEFTDYQCPFCAQHASITYPALKEGYEGTVRYVVRNFPMSSLHPWAQKAAEAAECAHDQGAFWEYHDRLFAHQTELDVESLKRHAAELGLDGGVFEECLDSGGKAGIVRKDLQDGVGYGVRGTPTFFVNGRALVGAQPLAVFESFVESALQEEQASAGAGSGSRE